MANVNEPFVDLFNEAFKGRPDVYPRRWEFTDRETGKKTFGYSPVCANRRNGDLCPKNIDRKAPCKDCQNKSYVPLADEILNDHFDGKEFLGVYPLLTDNTCWFIAADFDKHDEEDLCDPFADVKRFYEVCEVNEIPCYLLRSRSGNGFHGYIFFDKNVPAWKARLVVFEILKEAQVIGEDDNLSSFDRLFPNQDALSDDKPLGNLIGLPFQGTAMQNGNTMFLDPATDFEKHYDDQIAVLSDIQRITEKDLDRLIEEWDLKREEVPAKANYKFGTDSLKNEQFQKILQCDFIKWGYENQSVVSEPLWFDIISNVSRISPGGVELCHSCSKDYPKYSRSETDTKILNAIDGSAPHTCDEIKKNGYTCAKNCGVKSPAGLIFKRTSSKNQISKLNVGISMDTIVEIAKNDKTNAALKIMNNPAYIGSLALAAETEPASYETTLIELKNNGLKKTDVDSIKRVVKVERKKQSGLRLVTAKDKPEPVKVKQVVSDAPVQDDIIIPFGWELSHQGGLEKVRWKNDLSDNSFKNRVQVAPVPIVITARMLNSLSGTEAVRLAWYRDGKWKQHIADRKMIATVKDITALADVGVPVTSLTAKDLVEYLSDFEAANIDNLPKAKVSDFLGWQKNKSGFLLGNKLFKATGGEENSIDLSETPTDEWKEDSIAFRPADEGNQQISKSFSIRGTYEAWVKMINKLFDYPKVIAGVYFSLATAFLEILEASNFCVDWSYSTSTGKSTVLRVAGSCWGNPDEKAAASVLNTWDNTKVSIERTAMMLNGLPLLLDDTKLAGTGSNKNWAASVVSHIIYLIVSGKGRGRGSAPGLRNRGSWRTILLSSGEQKATEFTQDGGSRARVISLWGAPFDVADNSTGQLVNEVNLAVRQNYGHAGPKLMKFIFAHKDEWDRWQESYLQNQKEFAEKAGSNEVAIRISDYFATLATAIPFIHKALPELRNDPSVENIITDLWNTAIAETTDADRPTAALRFVYNWAVTNQAKFYGANQTQEDVREPHNGWAGVWRADSDNWDHIAFISNNIKGLLKEQGFDFDSILKIWLERGWLEKNEKRNSRVHQHRIGQQHAYCYRVTRKGISEAMGEGSLMQKNLVSDFAFEVAQKIRTMLPDAIDPAQMSQLKSEIDALLSRYGNNPFMPVMNQEAGLFDIFGGEPSESLKSCNPFNDYKN
jgi:uncharacterized protein (DUF927 family)